MSILYTSYSSKHGLENVSLFQRICEVTATFIKKNETGFAFSILILARVYGSFPVIHDMSLWKQIKCKSSHENQLSSTKPDAKRFVKMYNATVVIFFVRGKLIFIIICYLS